jgi:YesN/AraC family two-component response regulator
MFQTGGMPATMRREPEFFAEQETELVYIAKKLADALALEELLTSFDVDYIVETSEYYSGVIFQKLRTGAFFYVDKEWVKYTKQLLEQNGRQAYAGPG